MASYIETSLRPAHVELHHKSIMDFMRAVILRISNKLLTGDPDVVIGNMHAFKVEQEAKFGPFTFF